MDHTMYSANQLAESSGQNQGTIPMPETVQLPPVGGCECGGAQTDQMPLYVGLGVLGGALAMYVISK